jgi:hypothetical protein
VPNRFYVRFLLTYAGRASFGGVRFGWNHGPKS